jgi:hypothetical protein
MITRRQPRQRSTPRDPAVDHRDDGLAGIGANGPTSGFP